jgi:hypothetical protein
VQSGILDAKKASSRMRLRDDREGPHAKPVAVVRTFGGKVALRQQHLAGDIRIAGDSGRVV